MLFTHIHVQRYETLLRSTAFTATSMRHTVQSQPPHHQNLAPWPKMIFDMDQKYLPVLFDSFFIGGNFGANRVARQLLQLNAHSFIKITIILQHTSSYMFQAYWPTIRQHTFVQNSWLTFSARSRTARNLSMCNAYLVAQVVHWKQ